MVIADPQLHNVYGVGVKQMSEGANKITRVAIRPPELNLLAPIVLRDLTQRMQEEAPDGHKEVLLALGDVMNIACSGEFDLFLESLDGLNPRPLLLLAHGNHDTYLMGTVNAYLPLADNWSRPDDMGTSTEPVDEQWWGMPDAPMPSSAKNWRDACYDCGISGSTPMNKSRWLARYLGMLKKDGLQLVNTQASNDGKRVSIRYKPKPNSRLAAKNYRAEGHWVKPSISIDSTPRSSSLLSVYESYIVQQVDLSRKHRLFIIDTSVIEIASGGFGYAKNAGTNARIGREQIGTLKRLLDNTPAETRVTLAGHFPLNKLEKAERMELLDLLAPFPGWNYLSGHSHYSKAPHRGFDWGTGYEVNVASTTDWPMAANRIFLKEEHGMHAALPYMNGGSLNIAYLGGRTKKVPELCRHLPVATKIAEWKVDTSSENLPWTSPAPCGDCGLARADAGANAWQKAGKRLMTARRTIEERYVDEPEYKKFILSLAAAASRAEANQRDIANWIIP